MTEINYESQLEPNVVIAQERIRGLALAVCKIGSDLDGEYVLPVPQLKVAEINKLLGKFGLDQMAALVSERTSPFGSPCTIELVAETAEFQMFVEDMVNKKNPEGEIPIDGEMSWSANLGFIIPYTGTYDSGDEFLIHHRVIVAADSSDMLPTIYGLLDTQVYGESVSAESELIRNSTPLTIEECTLFADFVSNLYDQTTNR
jgi:hypothetical protein